MVPADQDLLAAWMGPQLRRQRGLRTFRKAIILGKPQRLRQRSQRQGLAPGVPTVPTGQQMLRLPGLPVQRQGGEFTSIGRGTCLPLRRQPGAMRRLLAMPDDDHGGIGQSGLGRDHRRCQPCHHQQPQTAQPLAADSLHHFSSILIIADHPVCGSLESPAPPRVVHREVEHKDDSFAYNGHMTFSESATLAGQFLIAMPNLDDPSFNRGVTLVCQHNEEGALGLLINRQSEYSLADILEQMQLECQTPELADVPVLIGGPLQQERGFVLHEEPGYWEASYRVNQAWSVTTSRDILVAMAAGQGPAKALLVLGYAGWDAGQLEQELKDNAWLTAEASHQVAFDTPLDRRWTAAADLVGVDVNRLTAYPGHA